MSTKVVVAVVAIANGAGEFPDLIFSATNLAPPV
jgi:hypothetical protein